MIPLPTLPRRAFMSGSLAALGSCVLPQASRAQTLQLQQALDSATQARRPFRLPPGTTRTFGLVLPDGARLVAAHGGSTLRLAGPGPLLRAQHGAVITLEGLTLDGAGQHGEPATGLLDFHDIAELTLTGCTLTRANGIALRLERCGGSVRHCHISGAGRSALFSLDALALEIADNIVTDCADNGIQIWRSVQGFDGTLIKANRIANIRNASGGTGQYGNGISIFRAGGVTASGNSISDVAFSALRNNSGHGVTFDANSCTRCGETAIFAEFAFRDAIIRDNRIDGAVSGIQMVNFADAGGRGALCTGNSIMGLHAPKGEPGRQWGYGAAIKAEADVLVAGNSIAGAPWAGVLAGWGPSLDAVRVESNHIGPAPVGIGVSVAPGAGRASVTGNTLDSGNIAVAAMLWDQVAGDLATDGGRQWPQVLVAGNLTV